MSDSTATAEIQPVVIVGGGPAGLAAGITLARLGRRPIVIDLSRTGERRKIGESLAPAAWPVLQRLGVAHLVAEPRHLSSPGTLSCWGHEGLASQDFLFSPFGRGWHLDRVAFEQDLRAFARSVGCRFLDDTVREVQRTASGGWSVRLAQAGTAIDAGFLLLATGRSGFAAKAVGAVRHEHDRLVAWYAYANAGARASEDARAMVEAMPEGWWYSALLPGGDIVAAFMTDAEFFSDRPKTVVEWRRLLAESTFTRERLAANDYGLANAPRFASAGSAILQPVAGPGWAACGDAAASFDPLSSHGIATALATGTDAAQACEALQFGDDAPMERYSDRVRRSFALYLDAKAQVYAQESRWPGARFWAARSTRP